MPTFEIISTSPDTVREWVEKPEIMRYCGGSSNINYIDAMVSRRRRIASLPTYLLIHDGSKEYKVGDKVDGKIEKRFNQYVNDEWGQGYTDLVVVPVKEEKPIVEEFLKDWGNGKVWDLSGWTSEEKKKFIDGFIQITGSEFARVFVAFGLKTHIEGTLYNESTNEYFKISFDKISIKKERSEDSEAPVFSIVDAIDMIVDFVKMDRSERTKDLANDVAEFVYDKFKQQQP